MYGIGRCFGGYGFFGGGVFTMIIPLILIAAIIYVVFKFQNGNQRTNNTNAEDDIHALRILNERFANGDITEEEYRRKKEMLRH